MAAGRDFAVIAHLQLSPAERDQLRAFLRRQQDAEGGRHHRIPAGSSLLLLWRAECPLARMLLPLFKRIEDFSVYARELQVGLPGDLLDDDIDNPEPVTLHDPRHC